jgi:hypothetical protein
MSTGDVTAGPDGGDKPSDDNFLNLDDLGVCSVCASTLVPYHAALIGYIGSSPPPVGSYTSTSVRTEAEKSFSSVLISSSKRR